MTSFKKGFISAAALAGATLFGAQTASAADLVTPPVAVKQSLASKFKYACDNKRPTVYVATKAKYTEQQWHRLLDSVVAGKYEIVGEIHNAKNQLTGLKLVKPFKYDNCEVKDHGSSHSQAGAKSETRGQSNGGQTGGNTGGQTGGNTGGQTGGNTGGQTGGNTGGTTGGNTGGQTGGNTGGQTGGNTGGQTGGNTGGNDCGDGGKGQHGQQGGGKGQNNGGNHGNGGHNGGGHGGHGGHGGGGGRHAMLENGVGGEAVATLAPVTTFKFG